MKRIKSNGIKCLYIVIYEIYPNRILLYESADNSE